MTILKALKHKYCLNLDICHKYIVQFPEPTPKTFWYAKRDKSTLIKVPILNTIQ